MSYRRTMMSRFDHLNAITRTKEKISTDDYDPYFVNRGLSQYKDTIFHANEMNINHHLSKDLQFSFLINTISSNKRYSKWAKKNSRDDDVISDLVEIFNCSPTKAQEYLKILSGFEGVKKGGKQNGRKKK